MMISAKRIERLVAHAGFMPAWGVGASKEFAYRRERAKAKLCELIQVHVGARGDSAYANVGVSVLRAIPPVKGLVENRPLLELANDPSRGIAKFASEAEASQWEHRLAEVAPSQVCLLLQEKGASLLERTAAARSAAAKYVSLAKQVGGVYGLGVLRSMADGQQRLEAARIVAWPGAIRVDKSESEYETAALALILFGDEVERRIGPFAGQDVSANREMMWRLQLIADHLLAAENGSEDGS